ncbi:aldose 1-epimerase family protein [Vagococcus xieshaowenii]|uniref:Aldose 1-epimerase family protein n=1 Tax=Vagococcus xieshaowenii TaxID=2562451 RepID=A0AAJ5EGR4_9ENTE|nr:aldose 1-epimerase family protein [Vagococcus xieshaowenii]QCA28487.1 aldose 1-epimerase family protein [Vagococcus xieshaowenii]TFZ42758.1 aldose 1-epimerase family protein [Vagococcus xieshaowenii]
MYTLRNNQVTATFKAQGAELTSLKLNENDVEFLWQGDPEFWGRQAPVLFPFVGRLKDDTYRFEGKTYHLPQHGFARDQVFNVLEHSKERITFSLKSSAETKANYPFDFELQIIYRLEGNQLTTTYRVENLGSDKMYYSVGGHPAFNVPINGDGAFEDYNLTVNFSTESLFLPLQGPNIAMNKKEVVEPTFTIPLLREVFKGDALVYMTDLGQQTFTLHSEQSSHQLTVSYEGLPFVGIWSPYPKEAPFVCIEPWLGIADTIDASGELTEKMGIQMLDAAQVSTSSYQIVIK